MSKPSDRVRATASEDNNAARSTEDVAPSSGPHFEADAAVDTAQQKVSVRVLPQGDGRIFTGAADDGAVETRDRFPTHGRGAVFAVAPAVAAELERRGLVEIQP